MWEKLTRLHIQNIIALVIIITCSVIVLVSLFHPPSERAIDMINQFFNMSLVGVIGWAFTQSKNRSNTP